MRIESSNKPNQLSEQRNHKNIMYLQYLYLQMNLGRLSFVDQSTSPALLAMPNLVGNHYSKISLYVCVTEVHVGCSGAGLG